MAFDSNFIVSAGITLVMVPLNGLILMLSAKIFKIADQSYKTAVKIALMLGIAGLVFNVISALKLMSLSSLVITVLSWLIVSILLAVWLIKTNYSLDWGKALLLWLVWFVLSIVAGFIIALIIGAVLLTVLFGALGKMAAA